MADKPTEKTTQPADNGPINLNAIGLLADGRSNNAGVSGDNKQKSQPSTNDAANSEKDKERRSQELATIVMGSIVALEGIPGSSRQGFDNGPLVTNFLRGRRALFGPPGYLPPFKSPLQYVAPPGPTKP